MMSHKYYLDKLLPQWIRVPEEDMRNQQYKDQEDAQLAQKKSMILKRKIQHLKFENITSQQAINKLLKEDIGAFYFRPSTRGNDHLTLSWKFYDKIVVHIDIQEKDKPVGANIGQKLMISDEEYENLQEIIQRYISPCNRSLKEVISHPKFSKESSDLDSLRSVLEKEKKEDTTRIPYRFAILEKYPQYVILGYIPKDKMIKEFIKIKPRGYQFHGKYLFPFNSLINWFKNEFKNPNYQRYIRKAQSP